MPEAAPPAAGSEIFRPGLLAGSVAVVTGAGSGIGRATALELARLGAQVVAAGRREEPLRETARLADDGRIEAIRCDIREEDDVDGLVDRTLERFGRIDLLVNNAGGQYLSPAERISRKGFRTVVRLNLEGTWMITHAVATRAMIETGRGGKIVCMTISPPSGMPGMAHSSAARAGIDNLVRVLSTEWARFQVKINSIALGSFATDSLRSKYPPSVVEEVSAAVPIQRTGSVEEAAWQVAFLASPAGDFTTGAVIHLDGGRSNWYGPWPPASYLGEDGELVAEERR